MKSHLLLLSLVAVSGLFLAGCSLTKSDQSQMETTSPAVEDGQVVPENTASPDENASPGTEMNQGAGETMTYTLEDVAVHNTKSDCWTVISGDVYDLSPLLASGKHPGGDAAVQACGKDGTTLFETRPMGSGTPHSTKAREGLANFLIGVLTQ